MDLSLLQTKITTLETKLNIATIKANLIELKDQSADPSLWDNPAKAQEIMQNIADSEKLVNQFIEVQKDLDSCLEYQKLLEIEPDDSMSGDLENFYNDLNKKISALELQTYLSGKYDKNQALLSIHAGQGGTEAMDWTSILHRMYIRYFERKNWRYSLIDIIPGDDAGLKAVYFKISVPYAYGYLKGENGTHRLVRLSPFNADQLRQTSFAKVDVTPIIENSDEVNIKPEDLEFSAFRAGGNGGQNVNKVSTAVRIIHKPSGIMVTSQNERSQDQNRANCMQMLTSKLWAIEQEKRSQETKSIKGDNVIAGWGHQIRSYVLHPYKMVKDLRTRVETSDTIGVLDGDLDQFIEAELKL